MSAVNILYEDRAIIVAEKPVGVPSQPDKTGDADMLSILRCGYPVQRLDRPVSGVMVFAKTPAAAAKLSESPMQKTYLAVVCGAAEAGAELKHWLLKNQRLNTSKAVPKHTAGAKEACLTYRKLAGIDCGGETLSLLEVELKTGRHHQIRVQLAASGLPIWGDTKYNPMFLHARNVQIGLAAYRLAFAHPVTKGPMDFTCDPYGREPFLFFNQELPFGLKG